MGLARLAGRFFDTRRRLDAQSLRLAKPYRNPSVTFEEAEGGVLYLQAPLSTQGRGVMGKIASRMGKPDTKKFELEEVGAFVWQLCDGTHSFEGISKKLRERYKMSPLEADASLTAFLEMLGQRRLITLIVKEKK